MLLAIDTATNAVTVALHDDTTLLAEYTAEERLRHGEVLAPAIDRLLRRAGASPAALTRIAVGVGPGPYTGLRIGLATASTMAAALGLEVVGVCTLDVVAADVEERGPFLVATDARRHEVYWARYASPSHRETSPAVDLPASVATDLPVAGNGPSLYPAEFPHPVQPRLPSAATLARLVVADGVQLMPALPLYLRRPDATVPAAGRQAWTVTSVRDAEPADLEAVMTLEAALFGADAWSREAMTAELAKADASGAFLVAVSRSAIVGYVVVAGVVDTVDVQRIAVTQTHQRRGIASALMRAATDKVVAAGCSRALLEVADDNAAARSLYEGLGFTVIDIRRRYYADGSDAAVMRRDLSVRGLDEQGDR